MANESESSVCALFRELHQALEEKQVRFGKTRDKGIHSTASS